MHCRIAYDAPLAHELSSRLELRLYEDDPIALRRKQFPQSRNQKRHGNKAYVARDQVYELADLIDAEVSGIDTFMQDYERIRAEANCFFVIKGHEMPEVEQVVGSVDGYLVVAKLGVGGELAEQLDPRRRS